MRPAIDHEGRIWFGEMGRNYLAVFDPRTQTFRQITPPHGLSGIMGVEVASDDTIWFAEQYANYIGHYFPTTGQFQVYQLPTFKTPDPSNPGKKLTLPSAPNDIAIDAQGNIWFTELNADAIGELDPHTGSLKQYPLAGTNRTQKFTPYGITVDPQGMIWFTGVSSDRVGRLDPQTGKITYFSKPGLTSGLMEITSDRHGTIWITSFSNGLLLSLDPRTGTFTAYYAPSTSNNAGSIYGVTISPNDAVWVTVSSANVIARLDVAAKQFVYYPIPTPNSLPFGIVASSDGTLWFTEAGSDKIGMLMP